MGIYLNPNNQNFYEAVNKEIYVDGSIENNILHSCFCYYLI